MNSALPKPSPQTAKANQKDKIQPAQLSGTRKFAFHFALANQYYDQLPSAVRSAVIGNAGTLVVFRVGSRDGRWKDRSRCLCTSNPVVQRRLGAACRIVFDSALMGSNPRRCPSRRKDTPGSREKVQPQNAGCHRRRDLYHSAKRALKMSHIRDHMPNGLIDPFLGASSLSDDSRLETKIKARRRMTSWIRPARLN